MLGEELAQSRRFGHLTKGVKESGLVKRTLGSVLSVKCHDHIDERTLTLVGAADLGIDQPGHDGSAVVHMHVRVSVGLVEHIARHFGEAELAIGKLFALRNFAAHRVEVLLLGEASALVANELRKVLGHALVQPKVLAHRRIGVVEVVNRRSVQAQWRNDVHEFVHRSIEKLLFDAQVFRHALARTEVAEVVHRRGVVLEGAKPLVAQGANHFDDSAHTRLAAEQNIAGPAKVAHHGQKRVAVHRKLRKKARHRRHVGLEFALKVSRSRRSIQVKDCNGHPRVGHPKSRGIGLGE